VADIGRGEFAAKVRHKKTPEHAAKYGSSTPPSVNAEFRPFS